MLGLRKNPLSRRNRNSVASDASRSSTSIHTSDQMEALRRQESTPVTPAKSEVSVSIKDVHASDEEHEPRQNHIQTQAVITTDHTATSSTQITHVIETSRVLKRRIIHDLDDVEHSFFEHITLEHFLEFIADERLIHMPRKGSQWDRVLKSAEYFALQLYNLQAVLPFVSERKNACNLGIGFCKLLLEVGHHQAGALEPTFDVLHEFGVLVSQTLQCHDLFRANDQIKEDLGDIYSSLISLVGEIALYYRQRISKMHTETVSIDFHGAFGKSIDRIWAQKEHLSNHLWSQKLRHKHFSINIESLRHKLSPADQPAKALLYSRLAEKAERAGGTCEWIQHHLLDFFRSNDRILTVTGASGCGKSVLAGWVKDRLRRPLGRKSYDTISFTFTNEAPAEARPLPFLKSLLHQLLERNVGDSRLYERLVKAFDAGSEHHDAKELESALWDALEAGLKTIDEEKDNMVIVVDGFDEVAGGESATHLHKKLHDCVQKYHRTKVITLSKPISHLGGAGTRHLVITPEHTEDDIATYLRQSLSQYQHFNSQNHKTQIEFISQLVKKAKGSFLWAYLLVKILGRENSYESFYKTALSLPGDVHGLLHQHVERIDMKNHITKSMLTFMLVAERPLSVSEMDDVLSVDTQKKTIHSNIYSQKHIASHLAVLVVIRKGLVRFKHSAVRKFFKDEYCSKALPSIKEAHSEFVKRLLFYAKYSLTSSYEPALDVVSGEVIQNTFSSHHMMEYVVRTWIYHYSHSTYHSGKEDLHLPKELQEVFPDSTLFTMIEWACWQKQAISTDVVHYHDLALRIRIACFGEKHRSVMQNLLILASFYRTRSEMLKASEFFYRASLVGQAVLHKFSTVVVSCTTIFLTMTQSVTVTTRTVVVTRREEMIKFMIEICKHKHGKSSDLVIKWYEVLAKLYVDLKEESRASVIYRELYLVLVARFGKSHPRTKGVGETLGGLTIVLKDDFESEIDHHEGYIFETNDEEDETDDLRITVILRLAKAYESKKQWLLAEKLYITLWRRICEISRLKTSVEIQIMKINIALEYIQFLQRIKRTEEASSILVCLWAEYEHSHFESETLIIRIKEIGRLFKAFGLLTVAVTVFAKVWGWFKSKGKTESEEALSTTVLITEVIEEITETTTTKKTTTITETTTTVHETISREIFETTYERCKRTKPDKHFFKSCMVLVAAYMAAGKWSESETVIRRSLELTWTSILTTETKLTLTGTYISECITLATQLATCYHRQRYFSKAEEIYLRIYHACITSLKIDDIRVTTAITALINFYEEYHRHEQVIQIRIEMLQAYRKHLVAGHTLIIQTLYALGSLCMTLGRKDAYDYYIEIVTILNKGTHCHHDAFEAAIIVSRYYYEEKRWTELQKVCTVLWETFVHHHHEFTFTEEMITTLYQRYIYVLEFHAKVEYTVLYKLTVQYRETVTKYFGVSAAILITAMIALAEICEKSESHHHESITIYEEVIKKITTTTTTTKTTTITETITKTVKKRLSKMYVTVITSGKSTSTTTIERGVAIAVEIFEHLKLEFGCWHEKTLTQLKEVVILYKKLGSSQSHTRIITLLQTNILEILTKVTTSITLYEAAISMASIYVAVGMIKYGQELLHQLRHLIVLRDIGSTEHITIKLQVEVTKTMFVFLAAFEQRIVEKTVYTYTEIMADILLEVFLYEQYKQAIKSETKTELVLEYGGKLRCFWEKRGHKHHLSTLDQKLFDIFVNKFGTVIKTHRDVTYTFYVSLLQELGKDRTTVDFGHIVCLVSNHKVKALLDAGDFQHAHEFAKCSFQLISAHGYYKQLHNVTCGYKLAEYMAGIDVRKPADNKTREAMLETSRHIVAEVLASCRAAHISFVSLNFADVAGLVRLLGDQQYYSELELLLEALWNSREVQRTWSPTTVLSIGKALVHAHYAAGHVTRAVELCDTICYNLRRSRGYLDDEAVDASRLLAALYSATGRHRDALAVDEEVLREIDEDGDVKRADLATQQVELLRRHVQRAGGWHHRGEKGVSELVGRLKRFHGVSGVVSVDQWTSSKISDALGVYSVPREWRLDTEQHTSTTQKRPGLSKWAARRSLGRHELETISTK